MLDNKQNHIKLYVKYSKMPLPQLQQELKELYQKRFIEHDIEYAELYRIVARAYNVRTRSGTGLIFHLKNFVPTIVILIIVGMFE